MSHVLPLSLERRRPGRIRPRLSDLHEALAALARPHLRFPSILVTGSNGKGSTAAMLDAVLTAHDVATGLYTSPHLVDVEERIRLRGRDIPRLDLHRHLTTLESFPGLTFFETLTAVALLAFAEARVDCAVLEAGMGGSWDATRCAGSRIAGLTNVGTDHQAWLGEGRSAIAADKGAALAAAEIGVFVPTLGPAIVAALGAPRAVPADSLVELRSVDDHRVEAMWDDRSVELGVPLPGRHQHHNLHLALALAKAAQHLGLIPRLDHDSVVRGLATLRWPGRLSVHSIRGRRVTVDVAHNLEGAIALADHLRRQRARFNMLFSCLDDKPVEAMARQLLPVVGEVALCLLDDERAMGLEQLRQAFPSAAVAATPIDALDLIPDRVLATGSLRLAGALLRHEKEPDS